MGDLQGTTTRQAASADIVRSRDEAAAMDRPPLVVLDVIEAFLDEHGLGSEPVHARPIGDGHSNPTFLLSRGDDRFVLRRAPRPPLPPSAHDVLREHRVTAALADTGVRVARPLAACEDESLLGVPFYVMEYVDGVVVSTSIPTALNDPQGRRAMAEELIDALAMLHTTDWRATGLGTFGRPEGFLTRQVARFSNLWTRNKTRELAEIDEVRRRIAATIPASRHAAVIHGDYRLGNLMFAATAPTRLVAIFDWELATVGDPLTDLGYFLSSYRQPIDGPSPLAAIASLTHGDGFPPRDDLFERYEKRTGFAIDDVAWYEALAYWKLAVILEGSYRRLLAGSTDDRWLDEMSSGVPELAARALQALRAG